jgi:spermidine/putrescine transport system substrate-binding protein
VQQIVAKVRVATQKKLQGNNSDFMEGRPQVTDKTPINPVALAAREFSRRTLLKTSVVAGAGVITAPWFVKDAFSSSGEMNLLMWSDEFPEPVISDFEKASGIKVNQTPFSQNEEQINKLQATGGEGFDLCQPTCNRAPQYHDLQVLAPFDTNKLKNMSALVPSMLANSQNLWTWDGVRKPSPIAPTSTRAMSRS